MFKKFRQWYQRLAVPENNPHIFLQQGRKSKTRFLVVCAGDSLTHGVLSADYVGSLAQRFSEDGYEFINAGINGDLAYNVSLRLDDILACNPDIVTLLIGTNDVNATFSSKQEANYRRDKQIPEKPTLDWYRDNVTKILDRLKAAGVRNLAVLSIPMLGENLDSEINQRVAQYNTALRELAKKQQVSYLPLYERLLNDLPTDKIQPSYRGKLGPILLAAFRKMVLGQSWESTSRKQGLHFLTDHIHLNEKGAKIIEELVEKYIREIQP